LTGYGKIGKIKKLESDGDLSQLSLAELKRKLEGRKKL
jgi:hypothetical protein